MISAHFSDILVYSNYTLPFPQWKNIFEEEMVEMTVTRVQNIPLAQELQAFPSVEYIFSHADGHYDKMVS